MPGFIALILTAAVRYLVWLATAGWPVGAGMVAYAVLSPFLGMPEPIGATVGVVVALICLWVRYAKRHPDKAKTFVKR